MSDTAEVIVCAGPPDCPYEDDGAVKNAQDGCPLCKRIIIGEDGSETVYRRQPQ